MRNLLLYYLAILLPFLYMISTARSGHSVWFIVVLLVYAIPYRMAVDGMRLVTLGLMKWNQVWKLLVPGTRRKYFRALYFKK